MSRRDLFAPVPDALVRDMRVGSSAMRLYSLLMRYANKDRVAWPRQSRLAGELDCSRRTIERLVAQLRDTGWITAERRENGGVCKYTMFREAISESCVPPDTDDGTVPTPTAGHIEREPLNESHDKKKKDTSCLPSPPRAAAVRQAAQAARDRDDALDPAKALDLWQEHPGAKPAQDAWRSGAPRRSPSAESPMGLALAWRARMQEARIAGALDTNLKALARLFRVLLDEGASVAQIRTMTNLYAEAGGLRRDGVAPWRHFMYQRHLLLAKARESEAARRLREDPDAWVYVRPTREQLREADRAYLTR